LGSKPRALQPVENATKEKSEKTAKVNTLESRRLKKALMNRQLLTLYRVDCVMNQNKKLLIAAVVSSFFGGTFSTAEALQQNSQNNSSPGGVGSHQATPSYHFSTVGSVPPIVSANTGEVNRGLPPIVQGQDSGNPILTLPPIEKVQPQSNSGLGARTPGSVPPVVGSGQNNAQNSGQDNLPRPMIQPSNPQVLRTNPPAPQTPPRPLQPVPQNDASLLSRTPTWTPSPNGNDPNDLPFPRSNHSLPSHSSSGVPFYNASGPALNSGLSPAGSGRQDAPIQLPQSVMTENGMVRAPSAGQPNMNMNMNSGSAPVPVPMNNGLAAGQTYFDTPMSQPGGILPTGGSLTDCPSCGPSGCFNESHLQERMGYFGAISRARRYLEVDLLYMTREGDSIVLTNFGGVGAFDWRLGWRGTLGTRFDATHGREISYFGTENIIGSVERVDALGRLSALFSPSSFYTAGEAAPFFNAQAQNELMRSRVHSLEFNRVNWAWDVAKSFIGLRFFNVDDLYQLDSFSGANSGTYRLRAKNNLAGVHIGREWFYDVGYRFSFSGLAKGGIYGNATRFRATADSNGTQFLNGSNNRGVFSTNLEFNLTGHYQINNRTRLRMGYQALVLDNMVTVQDNLSGSLNPFLGSSKANRDTMFFHGFNLGVEMYR
jgi:hypothetical protein